MSVCVRDFVYIYIILHIYIYMCVCVREREREWLIEWAGERVNYFAGELGRF